MALADAATLLLRSSAVDNAKLNNAAVVAEEIFNLLKCLALVIVQAGAVIK